MSNDDPRKGVPMTAELLDVTEVSLPMPVSREWTWDDLQRLPERDGHRYEIIDGSLHVSASPTPRHQLVAHRLALLLSLATPDHFEVVPAVDLEHEDSVLEPDILVVREEAAVSKAATRFFASDVLLVVEVESRSSRRMDRLAKPSIYAAAGIPAYWRVVLDEPDAPAVVVHELTDGIYREVRTVVAGESVRVDRPFPVELRPAELVGPRRRS
jgi:Uma2 family endonuclease